MDEAARRRVLQAGASAYAQAFGRVPPRERTELEAELEQLPTELRNAVTLALWHHPWGDFVEAVRRALVKPV